MTKMPAGKSKQGKNKKYMLVRYGRMDTLGFFEHDLSDIPKLPSRAVVETERGLELGFVVGGLSQYKSGQFKLSAEQVKKYFDDSGIEFSMRQAGKCLRFATTEDVSEEKHLQKIAEEEIICCRKFIKELNLQMKVVNAEHIFGGERIIFYFMAESRIDFRELVRKLAQEYQTRIEMRQIGSRDEAKLLGDYETCGQECCCRKFLKNLKPVNMRMAKMQKATLDPAKISGYCGRLKCCLRYEDKTYTDLKKRLPKKNTKVKTEHGCGNVINTQILTQLVLVELENGDKVGVNVDEIEIISKPTTNQRKPKDRQVKDVPAKDEPVKDSPVKNNSAKDKSAKGKPAKD